MRIFLFLVVAAAVLTLMSMAFVRFAPSDVARWHQTREVKDPGDTSTMVSFRAVRRMSAPADDVLAAIEQRALATARTKLIAGSIEEGMMTFETRSRVWGFPDYTTVAVQGDLVVLYGRVRFGGFDHGVNQARIESWLGVLGPLTEPL